jgi:hypothetical protein
MGNGLIETMDGIINRMKAAGWKERDAIKEELMAVAVGASNRSLAESHLEDARSGLPLEVRWEIDEVLEALKPEEEPVEEEEEEPDPNAPLSAADLNLVYDDPRGLMVHKSKVGERYFLTQRDQRTGQPQTYELQPNEVTQLKTQLKGSPYWVLGTGESV